MFGKKKKVENMYIIGIKNYDATIKEIEDGAMPSIHGRQAYTKLIDGIGNKASSKKELGKFIKQNGKIKKEVFHFWEGMIEQGYTLVSVAYNEKTPTLEQLCNNKVMKYIGVV